jgi:1-acyl-sn-glycerol-3-phosphate acyltransferase
MRTFFAGLVLIIATLIFGSIIIVGVLFGARTRPGNVLDKCPRWWARCVRWACGVKIVLHNRERMKEGTSRIYISNHVSWFDVLLLAEILPRYRFIGKAEIAKVPVFGRASLATGLIPIERENRKAAFESYRLAAAQIKEGVSVVVFPEGTRGESYAIRPFKKGPFVLAAEAGVPMVPTLVYGTRDVLAKHSLRVRSGTVHSHFLEEIDPSGYTYEDRDELSLITRDRLVTAMRDLYGIESGDSGLGTRQRDSIAESRFPIPDDSPET